MSAQTKTRTIKPGTPGDPKTTTRFLEPHWKHLKLLAAMKSYIKDCSTIVKDLKFRGANAILLKALNKRLWLETCQARGLKRVADQSGWLHTHEAAIRLVETCPALNIAQLNWCN